MPKKKEEKKNISVFTAFAIPITIAIALLWIGSFLNVITNDTWINFPALVSVAFLFILDFALWLHLINQLPSIE